MNASQLNEIGEAFYGAGWIKALANELGYSERTMRRWSSGNLYIPDDLADELRELKQQRLMDIKAVTV